MSKYQEKERARVIELIETSELFEKCKAGGKFRGKERDFVLLNGDFNLIKPITDVPVETAGFFGRIMLYFLGLRRLGSFF